MMRWITLGAVAITLGLVLAFALDGNAPRLARTAAPRFARARPAATDAGGKPLSGEADTLPESNETEAVIVDSQMRVEDADPAELARAGTWRKALEHYAPWATGHPAHDAATMRHLATALRQAENPVARQNVIFLAAHALRLDAAQTLLSPLLTAGSEGDIEDVVCALAFAGDDAKMKRFLVLAQRPSSAAVGQLYDTLHEVEFLASAANDDARSILRSYRCYELLVQENYFRLAAAGLDFSFPSFSPPSGEWERGLLMAWLARYPGHPGSDDVAIRIGDLYRWSNALEAARWYDRASVLPDQYRTSKALRLLVEWTDSGLKLDALRELLAGEVHNRTLLTYILVRRIAAVEDCQVALTTLAAFAEREPQSDVAVAWRLRSLDPDPTPGVPVRLGAVHDRIAADRSRTDRRHPPREAMKLSIPAMARQFALWEQGALLERQMREASGNDVAALLLQLADLTLAEREMFFPIYARHSAQIGTLFGLTGSRRYFGREWTERSEVHTLRAFELYARIERLHPEFPRVDEAVYGQAAARARALDDRTLDTHDWRDTRDPGPCQRDLSRVLNACERCRREFPGSEVALRAAELARDCRARYPMLDRE